MPFYVSSIVLHSMRNNDTEVLELISTNVLRDYFNEWIRSSDPKHTVNMLFKVKKDDDLINVQGTLEYLFERKIVTRWFITTVTDELKGKLQIGSKVKKWIFLEPPEY